MLWLYQGKAVAARVEKGHSPVSELQHRIRYAIFANIEDFFGNPLSKCMIPVLSIPFPKTWG